MSYPYQTVNADGDVLTSEVIQKYWCDVSSIDSAAVSCKSPGPAAANGKTAPYQLNFYQKSEFIEKTGVPIGLQMAIASQAAHIPGVEVKISPQNTPRLPANIRQLYDAVLFSSLLMMFSGVVLMGIHLKLNIQEADNLTETRNNYPWDYFSYAHNSLPYLKEQATSRNTTAEELSKIKAVIKLIESHNNRAKVSRAIDYLGKSMVLTGGFDGVIAILDMSSGAQIIPKLFHFLPSCNDCNVVRLADKAGSPIMLPKSVLALTQPESSDLEQIPLILANGNIRQLNLSVAKQAKTIYYYQMTNLTCQAYQEVLTKNLALKQLPSYVLFQSADKAQKHALIIDMAGSLCDFNGGDGKDLIYLS